MTDDEEQDDQSTDGEQGTSGEKRVLTRNVRRSEWGENLLNILIKTFMNSDYIDL